MLVEDDRYDAIEFAAAAEDGALGALSLGSVPLWRERATLAWDTSQKFSYQHQELPACNNEVQDSGLSRKKSEKTSPILLCLQSTLLSEEE